MSRPQKRPPGSDLSTFTALLGLLLLCGLLVALAAMVMPQVLGIVVIVAGFTAMLIVHYLVWGWWLTKLMPRDEGSEDEG